MKALKTSPLIVLATTAVLLSGCSALDKFRSVQDDFYHDTMGISSDDPEFDSLRSLLKEQLKGVDRAKLELILDNRLIPSQRTSDMLVSKFRKPYLYQYQESDCNVVFEFDVDDKFNMFRQLTPELCPATTVKINGKQGSAFESALARQLWEQEHAYKVGSCRILKDAVSRFVDKGGNRLSIEEIKAYLAEDAAEKARHLEQDAGKSDTDVNSSNLKNGDVKTADSRELNEAVNSLEDVKALLRQTMAQGQNAAGNTQQ